MVSPCSALESENQRTAPAPIAPLALLHPHAEALAPSAYTISLFAALVALLRKHVGVCRAQIAVHIIQIGARVRVRAHVFAACMGIYVREEV